MGYIWINGMPVHTSFVQPRHWRDIADVEEVEFEEIEETGNEKTERDN